MKDKLVTARNTVMILGYYATLAVASVPIIIGQKVEAAVLKHF